ncbi:LysR family transcriptional regulator [Agrococcus sp. SGAir0287]|uniref:LysR family transcriptional regulator n=1 Tax=Agrococcus sp. SGAir0287 TaxID=2070347 RepID=UPI0010CCC8E1|nr:LysR family transcriptional regulator [Agrococcus sp. SGAir0287]QCR20717.1 LysR family transcriptional regulator [Agrococcus sp. SGAir0287]
MATRRLTDHVLDLDTLEVLRAVGSTRSLSAAARELGVTQQAVSARIRVAERLVGVPLVVRSSTGSTTTDAGRRLVELAEPVLHAARALDECVAALRAPRGELAVAASHTIAELLMPKWLSELRRSFPDVSVRLTAANSTTVIELVRHGRVDVGFIEGSTAPADLATLPLLDDELVLVATLDHPWTEEQPVAPVDIAATPLLMREPGSGTRATIEAWFAHMGLAPAAPAAELETTAIIRATARAGVAPAVLSLRSAEPDLATGELARIAHSGDPILRTFTAIWTGERSPAARAFTNLARALA